MTSQFTGYPKIYDPKTDFSQAPAFNKALLDPELDALALYTRHLDEILRFIIRDDWKLKLLDELVLSINGLKGRVVVQSLNTITITTQPASNTLQIGESHSARADNPHGVTATQVGADPAGTAAATFAAHNAAADPHPQYTTASEASAAAPVQSVGGKTGTVPFQTAAETPSTATGDIAATNVQAAIAELAAEKATVAQVASDLNANSAADRARANHTGTQTASTIIDFSAAADARIAAQKGAANGLATLDPGSKIPPSQLPSYVDDVLEFTNLAAFPATGETGKMYVALDTNKVYRWSGSAYIEISGSPGSTDSVPEGSGNLYFTNERAQDAVGAAVTAGTSDGVSVTYDDANNRFNSVNTDKGSTALAAHGSLADPHPQYQTQAEGDARYTQPATTNPTTIFPDATAAQGTAITAARSDHVHAIDAAAPVALGTAVAEGVSTSFARADHVHVDPVIAHEAAADPHPQYTTESEVRTLIGSSIPSTSLAQIYDQPTAPTAVIGYVLLWFKSGVSADPNDREMFLVK